MCSEKSLPAKLAGFALGWKSRGTMQFGTQSPGPSGTGQDSGGDHTWVRGLGSRKQIAKQEAWVGAGSRWGRVGDSGPCLPAPLRMW